MAGAFDAKVEISTKEARDGLIALRKEVKNTGEQLVELDKIIKHGKQNIILIAHQFTKLVAEQRKAAEATKVTAQADIAAARASSIRATGLAKEGELLARKANQEAQAARATAMGAVASARVTDIEARRAMAVDKTAAATRRAAASQLEMHDSLSNSRYLMYDVGATYGVLAAGLLAIPAATAAVAASYQKDFAQVIRVNETFRESSAVAQTMKDTLKDLSAEIPVAFGELSRITQLGAQMGVADDKLAAFTETTAKFVAVTGVSADTGATLFGRLETSFTEDVQQFPDFFERIGSSIARVGAATVATDPEIASMLTQIGPLGAAAGMSAHEVTGLSAALASVRVQPELARGTLTRVFGQLNRDVAEGSPRMAEFGKLMGITGEQAASLWKTDSSKFFTDLMGGLQGVQQEQGQLTTTLDKLGIKASRDVSALTKLAVGYDVLKISMDEANTGFTEGTALNDMSKPVFETLAAKLTEFANAWKNLADTVGAGGLGPLMVLTDMAKNFAIGLDSLIDKAPLLGTLIQVLMGIATVTALFLGFKAAQAFVMAGMIGFQQAATRGMSGGLGMANMTRTLAQTMLMAKGATDAQTKALLGQVGANRALLIASTTTANQLKAGTAGSFGVLASNANSASSRIRGLTGTLIGMAGGGVGIAIGALALLAGHLLSTGIEAEQTGKSIAEAMSQGAETGARAVAEAFNNRKVTATDGALGFSDIDKSVTQIAERSGVAFDKIVGSITKGEVGMRDFRLELEKVAQADGYKNLEDALANPMPGTKAADLQFLSNVVDTFAEKNVEAAKGLKAVESAAPLAGKGISDMGDESDDAAADLDKVTKALKDLNDEVFGTINAEAALQQSLANIGEGLQKSNSFSVGSEGGRENLSNVQDALADAQQYYNQLKATNALTAQEAAQGYAEFADSLLSEIRAFGGDTSAVDQMIDSTKQRFEAAIGGGEPVSVPVTMNTIEVVDSATSTLALVQGWFDANEAQARVGADISGADLQLSNLAQSIMEMTGLPYDVVLDALTDPAHEKAREVEALLLAITNDTYVAPVDADTSAAVQNVQNFVAYARTELSRIQSQANSIGGTPVGYGDGEGSMSPEQKAAYGQITTKVSVPTATRAPAQVRAPSAKIPSARLGGVADGYNKAADAAKKAGSAGKQAGKDIADGIDEAVESAEEFGNRLKTAMMSAYNQQYGLTKAADEYHSALNAINKKREDEIEQVSDLRDRIRELNDERDKELISAAKAKIEQSISLKYGEGARAADYGQQATESLNNAAAKQKEIDVANKEATTIQNGIGLLTGFSDAAIANREALRNLEVKMIDMVAAYAAQGHSTEEVRRYAQALTSQFQTDVGQIGFNIGAVGALQGSMERYIGVIGQVPQFVPTTVVANTEDASAEMTGFQDLVTQATAPQVQHVGISISEEFEAFLAKKGKYATMADINGDTFRPGGSLAVPGLTGGATGGSVDKIMGFNGGGLVPGKAPANPRADNLMAKVDGKGLIGIRSQEFIQPQEAVDYYGLSAMEAIRTMKMPKFSMGGSPGGGHGGTASAGSSVVGLDAETLAVMAEIFQQQITLRTENRVIAESANEGNKQLLAEGHRR